MPVAWEASASGENTYSTGTDISSLDTGSFTPAGVDRAVFGVIGTYQAARTHSDMDSGATDMSILGSQTTVVGTFSASTWQAVAPAASSQVATGVWTGGLVDNAQVLAVAFSGCDQTTPFEEAATPIVEIEITGSTVNDSIVLSGLTAGQKVLLVAHMRHFTDPTPSITPNGQTWDNSISSNSEAVVTAIAMMTASGTTHQFDVTLTPGAATGYYTLRGFKINDASAESAPLMGRRISVRA